MKVLDGRNAYKVPQIINLSEMTIIAKYNTEHGVVFCLNINDKYVPCCMSNLSNQYEGILCAEYKTLKGFNNYLKRQFDNVKEM